MNLERYLERIDPRQLRLLLAGGVLLLAALFFSLLWPQVKNYRALRHSQGILRQASTNQVELAQQQTTLRAGIAQLRHGLHGDMVDLPLKQVETRVIGLLQRLCGRHHLELASVIPRPGETVHVFRETVLDLEIHGDYLDFVNWLQDLQDELGFLVVKQFEITPIEPDQVLPSVAVKIQIAAYRSVAP